MGLFGSLVTLVFIIVACGYILTYKDMEWNTVNLSLVGTSNKLGLPAFTVLRVLCTIICLGSLAWSMVENEGIKIAVKNREGKLIKLHIKHILRLTFFTFWCWAIEGLYFLLATIVSGVLRIIRAFIIVYKPHLVSILLVGSSLLGMNLESFIGPDALYVLLCTTWVLFEV